jgi:predicted rRNA methylase YqxC with S4 and FtsJ domains
MSKKEDNRKNETLDWFLYREQLFSSRDEASFAIEKGDVIINGKCAKKKDYIPKKGDSFELKHRHGTLMSLYFEVNS